MKTTGQMEIHDILNEIELRAKRSQADPYDATLGEEVTADSMALVKALRRAMLGFEVMTGDESSRDYANRNISEVASILKGNTP